MSGPTLFYKQFFLSAVCPPGFTREGVNLNYYDDRKLERAVTPFIISSIEQHIACGVREDVRQPPLRYCMRGGAGSRAELSTEANFKAVSHASDSGYDAVAEIGELYDAVRPYAERPDVQFYVDQAVQVGGPVLEVGCGTGRVLIPTARRGVDIAGIDNSIAMLDRCRDRLANEEAAARSHVSLHRADMRDFDLGQTFSLATIPFRPLQHLLTTGDQIAALRSIHRHLDPGGLLIFDVFNPSLALLAAGARPELEDTPPTPLPGGRTFRRTGIVRDVHIAEQISDISLVYYLTDRNGGTERLVHEFRMRWYLRFELEHLLARAGFAVRDIHGNFDKSELVDGSPELIFVAERD